MKRRTYWIKNGDFSNVYDVRYCESGEQETNAALRGYVRVPREIAIGVVRAERTRRKENGAFSGFASAYILPMVSAEQDLQNYPWCKRGYFVEKEN